MTSLYVDDDYWVSSYAQTGVTIDWANKIIFVPKTETLLLQSTPTEIRQLNLDDFRRTLKDLEDDAEGMTFLDTHRHVPPITVGGVTLARIVEIINGYTITFEDGQYAVNLVGANSNIGDATNVNQVSVRSANSAGLTDLSSLQAASYNGGVALNVNSIYSGTTFPVGTRGYPVNNMADALAISLAKGLKNIYVASTLILTDGYYQDYRLRFIGESVHTQLYLSDIVNVGYCEFENLTVSGYIDNGCLLRQCVVSSVVVADGTLFTCAVAGTVTVLGNQQCTFLGCYAAFPQEVVLDYAYAADGHAIVNRDWHGDIRVDNCSNNCISDIGISSGVLEISASVTDGVFNVYENAEIVNAGTATVNDKTTYVNTSRKTWGTDVSSLNSIRSIGEKIRKNLIR